MGRALTAWLRGVGLCLLRPALLWPWCSGLGFLEAVGRAAREGMEVQRYDGTIFLRIHVPLLVGRGGSNFRIRRNGGMQ